MYAAQLADPSGEIGAAFGRRTLLDPARRLASDRTGYGQATLVVDECVPPGSATDTSGGLLAVAP